MLYFNKPIILICQNKTEIFLARETNLFQVGRIIPKEGIDYKFFRADWAPFHPIEMRFSPEIIEFYSKNYYQAFTIWSKIFFLIPNLDIIYDVTIAVT